MIPHKLPYGRENLHIICYGNVNFPIWIYIWNFKNQNCIFDPKNYFSGIVLQNEIWSTQKVGCLQLKSKEWKSWRRRLFLKYLYFEYGRKQNTGNIQSALADRPKIFFMILQNISKYFCALKKYWNPSSHLEWQISFNICYHILSKLCWCKYFLFFILWAT